MIRCLSIGVAGPQGGGIGLDCLLGEDGEIKGPGPFRSMSLVLLMIFRDLGEREGPGFQSISSFFIGLSGTCGRSCRYV